MKITKSWLDDYLDASGSTAEICHELTYPNYKVTYKNIFFEISYFSIPKMQKNSKHNPLPPM